MEVIFVPGSSHTAWAQVTNPTASEKRYLLIMQLGGHIYPYENTLRLSPGGTLTIPFPPMVMPMAVGSYRVGFRAYSEDPWDPADVYKYLGLIWTDEYVIIE